MKKEETKKAKVSPKKSDKKSTVSSEEKVKKEIVAEVEKEDTELKFSTKKKSKNTYVKKSDHSAFKILLIIILAVALLTWIIKAGTWNTEQGVTFTLNEEPTRTGINELFLSFYYGINYYLIYMVFLGVLGIFYGIISKTGNYKAMVKKIASFFKDKQTIFALTTSLFVALLTAILSQPIVVLIFIPLLYSVAKELKINKVSAMMMTYGALAVGLMGAILCTYGTYYASQNMGIDVLSGWEQRLTLFIFGYLLINFFIVLYNKKNKDKNLEIVNDNFITAEDSKSAKAWPYLLMFGIILVIVILGYVSYDTVLGIKVFTNFHEWLTTKVVIGSNETPIFAQILGSIGAFGTWDAFVIAYILLIVLIFVKIFNHISLDELFDNALSGLKKVAKPIMLIIAAYSVFVLCYWSGITNTIVNFFNSGENFNPYLTALGNSIADFLHVDVEYTGFTLGTFYAAKFADHTTVILTIMAATNGFIAIFAPTSIFMLAGLALSDLSYKEWIKSTWKLVLALAVVLCLVFTIFTFIF